MMHESFWQCCVSLHASLRGNSMRQICRNSIPGETRQPSISQISTNTRLIVCHLVYWEVNRAKTQLCVCKVARFARGRQLTKDKTGALQEHTRCLLLFLVKAVFCFVSFFKGISQLSVPIVSFLSSRYKQISCLTDCHWVCNSDKQCPE